MEFLSQNTSQHYFESSLYKVDAFHEFAIRQNE